MCIIELFSKATDLVGGHQQKREEIPQATQNITEHIRLQMFLPLCCKQLKYCLRDIKAFKCTENMSALRTSQYASIS